MNNLNCSNKGNISPSIEIEERSTDSQEVEYEDLIIDLVPIDPLQNDLSFVSESNLNSKKEIIQTTPSISQFKENSLAIDIEKLYDFAMVKCLLLLGELPIYTILFNYSPSSTKGLSEFFKSNIIKLDENHTQYYKLLKIQSNFQINDFQILSKFQVSDGQKVIIDKLSKEITKHFKAILLMFFENEFYLIEIIDSFIEGQLNNLIKILGILIVDIDDIFSLTDINKRLYFKDIIDLQIVSKDISTYSKIFQHSPYLNPIQKVFKIYNQINPTFSHVMNKNTISNSTETPTCQIIESKTYNKEAIITSEKYIENKVSETNKYDKMKNNEVNKSSCEGDSKSAFVIKVLEKIKKGGVSYIVKNHNTIKKFLSNKMFKNLFVKLNGVKTLSAFIHFEITRSDSSCDIDKLLELIEIIQLNGADHSAIIGDLINNLINIKADKRLSQSVHKRSSVLLKKYSNWNI